MLHTAWRDTNMARSSGGTLLVGLDPCDRRDRKLSVKTKRNAPDRPRRQSGNNKSVITNQISVNETQLASMQ